jgi:hypothetical protein
MWANRHNDRVVAGEEVSAGAFVAVPVAMSAGAVGSFQQQLYLWAYEQAKQATEAARPAPVRELFAILN